MKLNKISKMCVDAKIIDSLFTDDEFFSHTQSYKKLHSGRYPKTDQWCDEKSFNLAFALAGFDPEDILVYSEGRTLFVETVKKEGENKSSENGFIHRGIAKRYFKKSYFLDERLDLNSIKAKMKNGLLTISISFSENIKKRISVEVICD